LVIANLKPEGLEIILPALKRILEEFGFDLFSRLFYELKYKREPEKEGPS
jgi:hypothetical protein